MAQNRVDFSLKERTAQLKREKRYKKIIMAVISLLLTLLVFVYVISVMYAKFGDFTISVNKYHYLQYGLTLSDTKDFSNPTASLNCKASELITNIEGKSLDNLDLGAIDGNDSGDNYLCYTFYLKNAGEGTVTFEYSIVIVNMTLDIEKAVRLRLITKYNGGETTKTDYARISSTKDEKGNFVPEPNTTPFREKNTIMWDTKEDFAPNDVMKYTVVMWLEGPDPECTDDIIGGEFKIDMKFNIIGGAST